MNTYTKIYIQAVFSVKYRKAFIDASWSERLYQYLGGILKTEGHHPIAINGVSDHVHVFFSLKKDQSVSDIIMLIKGNSSKWINEQGFCSRKFQWQQGYGAFSYGASQVKDVIRYVDNQEAHHRKMSFREEVEKLLELFEVPYEEQYLPEELL